MVIKAQKAEIQVMKFTIKTMSKSLEKYRKCFLMVQMDPALKSKLECEEILYNIKNGKDEK